MRIGIVGASGFIGRRAVEMLHEEGMDVCPIARTSTSLSQLPANLERRVANALNQTALQEAFKGCDVVVHSILGNPGLIRGAVATAYRAAEKAGVRRLIYLSSMCVHSQAPAPGTTEETPLKRDQPFPYNTAKIEAEQALLQLQKSGSVEVVIFRPGIVFGPRSGRVLEVAEQLLNGTACLVDDGKGICNTVYIDNLVHAIQLTLTVKEADGQAFFVGDRELLTWLDFYRPFAEALGVDLNQLHRVTAPETPINHQPNLAEQVRESVLLQKITSSFSEEMKQWIRQWLLVQQKPISEAVETLPISAQPDLTPEMALLQQSKYKLPYTKATKLLGYEPIVSFEQGCQESLRWLSRQPSSVTAYKID